MNLEHNIIFVYLQIEEKYQLITKGKRIRAHGFEPALSDAEILTMEIIGEMQGHHSDKAIWRYFREHWFSWFPKMGSYKNFTKHASNLAWIKQKLLSIFTPSRDEIHIIDGVPMPICHKARAYRCKSLPGLASWGYCASKDEYYYGVRGYPLINLKGQIVSFSVTPANISERDILGDMIGKIKGILLGDKGFLSKDWQVLLRSKGIILQTPLRDNMRDTRPKEELKAILKMRRLVETVIGVLTESFDLNRIRAKDIWRLSARIYRKIIAYNFYIELKRS
jgi:hypothetical protein